MLDLAVIIVTWNVRHLIHDTLRTLYDDLHTSGLDAQVWVVDNDSTDGTADVIRADFPAVQLIASPTNLGFAGGNNAAMRALGFCDQPKPNPDGPRVVFLLNPDTLTQPGAIRALYDALFQLPRAGVVGARLSYEDGTFQHSAFRFPGLAQIVLDLFPVPGRLYYRLHESRLNGRYSRALYKGNDPFPVDHVLGATIMLKREVIEQVGLFDEQFFMYCEEIDWAMRIRQAGWDIYTVPTAHITHLEAKSSSQIRPQSIVNLWTSRLRLYRKHYSRPKLALARLLVRLGMQQKIRSTQRDTALSADQRAAFIEAYRMVVELART
ncbi:MAG: glycosyltransferase family 2 protein [Anaerolineae bacterium]|nr:glycosyltransferase family 2 protein [Anaerolineae bacterium]